jgi:hypothetical protein
MDVPMDEVRDVVNAALQTVLELIDERMSFLETKVEELHYAEMIRNIDDGTKDAILGSDVCEATTAMEDASNTKSKNLLRKRRRERCKSKMIYIRSKLLQCMPVSVLEAQSRLLSREPLTERDSHEDVDWSPLLSAPLETDCFGSQFVCVQHRARRSNVSFRGFDPLAPAFVPEINRNSLSFVNDAKYIEDKLVQYVDNRVEDVRSTVASGSYVFPEAVKYETATYANKEVFVDENEYGSPWMYLELAELACVSQVSQSHLALIKKFTPFLIDHLDEDYFEDENE